MSKISNQSDINQRALRGADNLLQQCIGIKPGQSVLMVSEPASEQCYEPELVDLLVNRIQQLGAKAVVESPVVIQDSVIPESVAKVMADVDHTLFLSRMGDYARFASFTGEGSRTICYTRSIESLGAQFSITNFSLMQTLHQRMMSELMAAKQWRIRCDLGTNISGTFCWPSNNDGVDEDFSMTLFPVTTFKPVPCDTANGKVALSRWLAPGGAHRIPNGRLSFDGVCFAKVRDGELAGFDGPKELAQKMSDHYDYMSQTLSVSRNRIHSWHAGINPNTQFSNVVNDNLEAWEAISFASPRYLHFHTCGDNPPCEIAWSVFNPTVEIDGVTFWQDGELVWLQRDDNVRLIRQVEGAECLLNKSADIGI